MLNTLCKHPKLQLSVDLRHYHVFVKGKFPIIYESFPRFIGFLERTM